MAFPTIADNCWYELAAPMEAVAPSPVPAPGGTAYRNVMAAWGSAAWDFTNHLLLVFGGGHTDYSGNEIYGFDPNAGTWSLKRNPCAADIIAASGGIESSGYYATNTGGGTADTSQPVSRHTYDQLVWSTNKTKMVAFGAIGTYPTAPTTTNKIDMYSPTANTWEQASGVVETPFDSYAAICEGGSGIIWFMGGSAGASRLNSFNPADGTVVTHGNNFMTSFNSYYRKGVYDPINNRFWIFGGNGTANAHRCGWYDLAIGHNGGNQDFTAQAFTGATSIIDSQGPGAVWHAPTNSIMLWNGGTAIHSFDVTTNVCSAITLSGSNTVTPTARQTNGTFGRFRYMTQYSAFVAVNATDGSVFYFKIGPPEPGSVRPVFTDFPKLRLRG